MNYDSELSTYLYHQIPYLGLATVCNCSLFMTKQVVLILKSFHVVVSREIVLAPYLYIVNTDAIM